MVPHVASFGEVAHHQFRGCGVESAESVQSSPGHRCCGQVVIDGRRFRRGPRAVNVRGVGSLEIDNALPYID